MAGTKTGMTRLTAAAVAIVLAIWVSPALAGRAALSDDEMDTVTAGGQSTVLNSGDYSSIDFTDNSTFSLAFTEPNAQTGFTALTIQNVVGELQLLVNLNVLSASGNVAGTDQRNFSLQSWGGTLPIPETSGIVAGAVAAPCQDANSCTSKGGEGGTASGSGGSGGTGSVTSGGTLTQNGGSGPTTNSANGGTASLTVGDGVSTPPAVLPAASASGDLVVSSGDYSPITAKDDSQFSLLFAVSNAQSDLSALFISNVVGRSQMALNLNIASSAFTTVPFQTNSIGGDVTGTIKQVNTGIQFRGTPLVGATGVTTSVNMTINHQNQ
jgi:hypothetical protein